MKHTHHHSAISPLTHYAVLASLLISNLTVLGLGILLAGPVTGNSLGYFAYLDETHRISKASAATKASLDSISLSVKPCKTLSGNATSNSIDPSQRVCPPSGPQAPAAPSNLSGYSNIPNAASLWWTDESINEVGFKLERGTGTPTTTPTFTWNEIATPSADSTNYYDLGQLTPGTTYAYRIRAYNGAGNSDYSNQATVFTPTLPAAPTNLYGVGDSPTSVLLRWTDNSNDEDFFSIDRATGTPTSTPLIWGQIASVPYNPTSNASYTDTNCVPGGHYSYRVRAFKYGAGPSAYSNVALGEALPSPLPAAPMYVSGVYSGGPSQITLTWNDMSTNETGFRVERGTSSVNSSTPTSTISFSFRANTPANSTPFGGYTDNGPFQEGVAYWYRVRAFNNNGSSAFAEPTSVPVYDNTPPTTPTNLHVTQATCSDVAFAWDPSSDAHGVWGYKIYEGGLFARNVYNATQDTSPGGFYAVTSHIYSVAAFDYYGNLSGQSAFLTANRPLACAPVAPRNTRVTNVTSSTITFTWDDYSNNETVFYVERQVDDKPYTQVDKTPANVATDTDTGLDPQHHYCYIVRAANSYGNSDYSQEACAWTNTQYK